MQLRLNYAYVNDGLELLVIVEVRIIENILHNTFLEWKKRNQLS